MLLLTRLLLKPQYFREDSPALLENPATLETPTDHQLHLELRAVKNKYRQSLEPGSACTGDTTGIQIGYVGEDLTREGMFPTQKSVFN